MNERSGHVRRIEPGGPPDWRAARAVAREADALTIDAALEKLAEVEQLFEFDGDDVGAASIRSTAAFLRARRNDRMDKAELLRAEVRERVK